MFEWDEGDRYSFEDSERFEEESECSWLSEPESLCNNWRGWKKQINNINNTTNSHSSSLPITKDNDVPIKSLAELCARTVAAHMPFEVVEQMMPVVPEQIQLWIAYWSFPDNEEDIRLYSCLANGNADEFVRGDNLYKHGCVEDVLQIGFHLSATVVTSGGSKEKFKVAVAFDRGRIASCNCTCNSLASWCSHVVAVCLNRIHQPNNLKLRAPVSESLSQLQRDQLQKFAQYLISELPQQILPTAQRLIDEILSSQHSNINAVSGAPDPTAGASASEQTAWWLDENNLHENIKKILVKFCVPSPMVFSDVNYLSTTAPPVATEWQSLLRPLRGREPEGMWNLLSIVREMFKRQDHNAIPLLEVITKECIATEKILVWWVNTRVALHLTCSGHGGKNSVNSNSHGTQYACSSLCDEIVILWRLAALNPALSPAEREMLMQQFKDWHLEVQEKVARSKDTGGNVNNNKDRKSNVDWDFFSGFKAAIEACLLDWNDYPLSGITYSPGSFRYYCPVLCCKHDSKHECHTTPISAPQARMPPQFVGLKRNMERRIPGIKGAAQWVAMDGSRSIMPPSRSRRSSSVSSEGFCDNDGGRDSDSSSRDRRSPSRDLGRSRTQNIRKNVKSKNWSRDGAGNSSNSKSSQMLQDPDVFLDQAIDMDESNFNEEVPSNRKERRLDLSGYRIYVHNPNPHLVDDLLRPNVLHPSDTDNRTSQSTSTDSDNPKPNDPKCTDVFSNIKKLEDSMEILFARAEALHAHGHTREASQLAIRLSEELLENPPNFSVDVAIHVPKSKRRKEKLNPASHHLTRLASATLTKCAFLCTVLSEDAENTHLAFQVSLFGLEMLRPPASTKPLEVKLANQESDLVNLLKKLTLGPKELSVIREKAELLSTGNHNARGESMLPLMLAAFIFDALVVSTSSRIASGTQNYRHLLDENLGFEAAVAALSMKANVSEADHPLLCEGTRRQRGELALTLLTYYKDDSEKLAIVMDKLLDKEVHQMYKAQSLPTYYASKNNSNSAQASTPLTVDNTVSDSASSRTLSPPSAMVNLNAASTSPSISTWTKNAPDNTNENVEQRLSQMSLSPQPSGGARPKNISLKKRIPEDEESVGAPNGATNLSASGVERKGTSEESQAWIDEYKDWQKKVSKQRKRNQVLGKDEMEGNLMMGRSASWVKRRGPGSDSGSSGNSSDSVVSISSGDKGISLEVNKPVESPPLGLPIIRPLPHTLPDTQPPTRSHPPFPKVVRYKGKRAYPTVPNQPSEATAYFMFELAKTVLSKAGGNSSTSLFKQPPANQQNHRGPHRALQMCAFQIGLYALGLNNCVSPNWLSRTYSSHVSWISNQAMEIGSHALSFLIDTWEGHLTPQEAASIADKASRGRDANTIRQAARLALSCLPHAHALNPNEIQRAIIQCKELSSCMLEEACLAVEMAAKEGGVYPEVLFSVARCWYELYETRNNNHLTRHVSRRDAKRQTDSIVSTEDACVRSRPSGVEGALELSTQHSMVLSPSIHSSHMAVQESASSSLIHTSSGPVGMNVSSLHATTAGVPTYSIGAPHSQSIGFSIPTAFPYQIGYNYISNLPPSVSCINAQMPVQMYIQPSGVPFHGTQGTVSPAIFPPPPIQSLQYYPPITIPSSQGGNTITSPTQSIGVSSQLQGASSSNMVGQGPMNGNPQPANLIHPPTQGYLPLPISGQIPPTGFINNCHSQSHMHGQFAAASVVPFGRGRVALGSHHAPQGQSSPQAQHQAIRGALVAGSQQAPPTQQQLAGGSGSMQYLLSAYRVGMLAMDTLARRVQDDRPQAKYARNPAYGEDVKWLLNVAKKLGTQYLHQFCICSVNSVISPFVLYDLAVEVASFLSRNSPSLYQQNLRSPILQPLIQKCQQMFVQCTHMKMYYITPSDYDEFISIIRAARLAFQMTAGGVVQFNELLQSLRRSKCCKKELWQRISSALQCAPSV